MAKRKRKLLIPEAREAVDMLKSKVMKARRYSNGKNPDEVKYEIASELGIPLKKGYNGNIKANEAGKIGGVIGGNMVKEMVRMAEQQLANRTK
ncbi:alpha/beta-type small acid-soluble spore protein [Calidifontibacillus erzurumensis]|uniref:Alpha/beta-type small acid-soluble spore protein n=1 Tax=Calidifontibacillus erzurumensis TaxID=2741433 RepID=A0A8J8KDG2_9BACI|nr:alpha/beta-type small acid-soluble spore protein [Calidifontibacillus erzurumensis]NSL50650.1 alpha/beta-type small acid-soluble spore protein [Calidifontibacillus erzurumensis]